MRAGARERRKVRSPLSRERVLGAAIRHADKGGLGSLTIRTLAQELGVAPMALYRHVTNKEDLIDGMVEVVFSEIGVPTDHADWKTAMRWRAMAARDVLARHRWAIGLMESRSNPGPATLAHHDAVIGILRHAGFSIAMTAHAYSLLDSYIYGFALQQVNMPYKASQGVGELAESILRQFPKDTYPNLAALAVEHVLKPGYDFADEFTYGLDLILGTLERIRAQGRRS